MTVNSLIRTIPNNYDSLHARSQSRCIEYIQNINNFITLSPHARSQSRCIEYIQNINNFITLSLSVLFINSHI